MQYAGSINLHKLKLNIFIMFCYVGHVDTMLFFYQNKCLNFLVPRFAIWKEKNQTLTTNQTNQDFCMKGMIAY